VTGFFHCGDELAESPSLSGPLVTMTGSKSEGLADGVGAYMSLGPWRVHLLAGGREADGLPGEESLPLGAKPCDVGSPGEPQLMGTLTLPLRFIC
jgi:hypothetical protein